MHMRALVRAGYPELIKSFEIMTKIKSAFNSEFHFATELI